jgi:hypothetical protein
MKSSVVATLFALLVLVCCASAPRIIDPSGVDVSVSRLTPDQALMSFSATPADPNPYRTPGGLLMGYPNELVVLRFDISAATQSPVAINAITATGNDDSRVARYFYIDEYAKYIAGWQLPVSVRNGEIVKETYLPGDRFVVRQGKRSYYAVLVGKNPIPRPFQVRVDLCAGNDQSRIFTFDITGK